LPMVPNGQHGHRLLGFHGRVEHQLSGNSG